MKSKKTLEISPTNPVVTKIIEQIKANAEHKSTKKITYLFQNILFLSSDFSLKNPAALSFQIKRMISVELGIQFN
jgi:HSP90 family molecular chaperone